MKKVVVFGMSCVGKTTYAKSLDLPYFCFDALFPWDLVEAFPELSITKALIKILADCEGLDDYVVDGWHLSDIPTQLLPEECEIHVLYDHHQNILDRYRVSVVAEDEHREMWRKWYGKINDDPRYRFFRIRFGEQPESTSYEHFNNFRKLEWLRLAGTSDCFDRQIQL